MLTVTRRDFDFKDSPKYYFGGNQVVSHMLNALSGMFPDGEQFFVDSVREFRDRIPRDDDFQKEISGFIGQEAMHSMAHSKFNEYCHQHGIPVNDIEKGTKILLTLAKKVLSPRQQLAATVCLEHYTAIMAEQILMEEKFSEQFRGVLRDVWMWHAGEEVAHAHVAWDLYHHPNVGGSYEERVFIMALATAVFTAAVVAKTGYLCSVDGWKTWHIPSAVKTLFGKRGFYTNLIPVYLKFFERDFHPNQHTSEVLRAINSGSKATSSTKRKRTSRKAA